MADLSGYRFTSTHEWVHLEAGVATIGISDHAQAQLGDVIFLELPEVGSLLQAGARFGAVESVKAASDLYAPVTGTVLEVNSGLATNPEAVNRSPYEDGWLVRLGDVEAGEVELMDASEYLATSE